jgi:hypothetical protein
MQALVIFIAVLLAVVGLGFIAMYLWDGVIARWEDPDQSLLFWYLPILFIGIFCFIGGISLFIIARKKLRR